MLEDLPALLTIRPATYSDIGALVSFARQAFRDTYYLLDDPADIDDYVTRHFTAVAFDSILRDTGSTLLLATVNQRLTGYALLSLTPPPAGVSGPSPIELSRLYLGKDALGKGYGSVLMRAVVAEARRQQCQTIWLGVYDRNLRARAFYKRWGFVDVATKEFLFGGRSYFDPVMAVAIDAIPLGLLDEKATA
jgi:GNAT superfamily N-acetyltransferase